MKFLCIFIAYITVRIALIKMCIRDSFNRDPLRERRLLLHKREIRKLAAQAAQMGYALVPRSLYFKDARVKLELGVCKGKKLYDKRADAAKRDAKRNIDRALRERNR